MYTGAIRRILKIKKKNWTKKLVLLEEKFVKWQNSRNECCDFTEKIMSKYALLKLADYKWHLTKVNDNPENWQCVVSFKLAFPDKKATQNQNLERK